MVPAPWHCGQSTSLVSPHIGHGPPPVPLHTGQWPLSPVALHSPQITQPFSLHEVQVTFPPPSHLGHSCIITSRLVLLKNSLRLSPCQCNLEMKLPTSFHSPIRRQKEPGPCQPAAISHRESLLVWKVKVWQGQCAPAITPLSPAGRGWIPFLCNLRYCFCQQTGQAMPGTQRCPPRSPCHPCLMCNDSCQTSSSQRRWPGT